MGTLVKIILNIMAAPFVLILFVLLIPAILAGMFLDGSLYSWFVAAGAELTWLIILFTLLVGLGIIR